MENLILLHNITASVACLMFLDSTALDERGRTRPVRHIKGHRGRNKAGEGGMRTVGKGVGLGFSGWMIGGSLICVVLHEQRFIGGAGV